MVSRGFQKRNFCGEQKRKGFFSFRICFHPFRTFGLLLKRMSGRTPCSGFFNTADRVPSTWRQVGGKCRQLGGKSSQVGGKLHCRIGRSRLRHNRPKRFRITVHEQEQRLQGLLLALCRHLRYCFMDAAMKYCATITVGHIVPYQIPTGTNPMQTSSGTSPSAERSSCCRLPRLDAPNPR